MLELVTELLECILAGAVDAATMLSIVYDGPPARFIVHDPKTGVTCCAFVPSGELVRVNRAWRLLVEPVASVRPRPLCVMSKGWVTA